MRGRIKDLLIFIFFLLISVFIFRNYIFRGQIPFPANLLVSYYEPWKSYPDPAFPNGPSNKPIGFDNLRQFYPQKTIAISSVKNNQIPLWNPYIFSGNTLIGTYISAIFHPFSFLYLILPQISAYSIIIIMQPFLASIFMFLFLKSIKLSRAESIFGALSFSLSGFMIVWWEEAYMIGYSGMVLPLILFSIEKLLTHDNNRYFLLFIFGVCWTVLSGSFQIAFYVLGFTFLYICYKWFTKEISVTVIKKLLLGLFIAFLVCGVHLFPGFESYLHSARGSTDVKYLFDSYLLPIGNLITFISPDFFGNPAAYNYYGKGFYHERMQYFGIVPFFMMLYALSYITHREKKSFWGYGFIFFLSLGYALPTSWFILYTLKLPFLSNMIPSRIMFLSVFCGSVLAAYGLQYFIYSPVKKNLTRLTVIISAIIAGIFVFILFEKQEKLLVQAVQIQIRNCILPLISTVFLTFLLWISFRYTRFRKVTVYSIIIISIIGSLYFANKYLYFSDPNMLFPQVPVLTKLKEVAGLNRFWSFGTGRIENNLSSQYGLYSPEGYESLYIRRYGELIEAASQMGKYKSNINRSDAIIQSYDRVDQILADPSRKKLLSLLGVRYIVGYSAQPKDITEKVTAPKELIPVWKDDKYVIYEYQDAYPRAFLSNRFIVAGDDGEAIRNLFDESVDLSTTLILQEVPAGIDLADVKQEEADITGYTAEEVVINVNPQFDSLLFLSDSYFPGWKAYLDGIPAKIYQADYAFRAVRVPKGDHKVIFRYEPISWKLGIAVSGVGMVMLIMTLLRKRQDLSVSVKTGIIQKSK